jgi:hypothetical protein
VYYVTKRVIPAAIEEPLTGSTPLHFAAEAYPNPSHGELRLHLTMPRAGTLHIRVCDVTGRVLFSTTRHVETASRVSLTRGDLDGSTRRLPSGMYYVRIEAEYAEGGRDARTARVLVVR